MLSIPLSLVSVNQKSWWNYIFYDGGNLVFFLKSQSNVRTLTTAWDEPTNCVCSSQLQQTRYVMYQLTLCVLRANDILHAALYKRNVGMDNVLFIEMFDMFYNSFWQLDNDYLLFSRKCTAFCSNAYVVSVFMWDSILFFNLLAFSSSLFISSGSSVRLFVFRSLLRNASRTHRLPSWSTINFWVSSDVGIFLLLNAISMSDRKMSISHSSALICLHVKINKNTRYIF